MNAIILLLFAVADPTGLQTAFESAETVDLSYDETGFTVTLVNPETIKNLAPLVAVRGEGIKSLGKPATPDIIRVAIHGKKTTEFWMIESKLAVGDRMFTPADDKLWLALRAYFEALDPAYFAVLKGDRIPGKLPELPPIEESVQSTLTAALKGADRLDTTYRRLQGKFPAGPDAIRKVHLSNLKLAGSVTYNAKKPEDPVEVVFVSKETRIPIYLVGDTAYWGGKPWRSVKLTRDSMWKQMIRTVPSPEEAGLKPDDITGLMAALESADSVELTHRATGKKASIKGKALKELIPLAAENKGVSGAMAPGNKFLEKKEVIDISVRKGEDTTDFLLVRGDDDATLVFGPQNLLAKMTNLGLWQELRAQFPIESAFPPKPK